MTLRSEREQIGFKPNRARVHVTAFRGFKPAFEDFRHVADPHHTNEVIRAALALVQFFSAFCCAEGVPVSVEMNSHRRRERHQSDLQVRVCVKVHSPSSATP